MAIYRFKVAFEEDDEIYRLIDIKSSQTFRHFNEAIHSAFGFDNIKPCTFFISNDNWRKVREISGEAIATSKMAGAIDDPHQKLLYYYDDANWVFQIELVKIVLSELPGATYPRLEKSVGIAPVQYKKNLIVADPDEDEEFDEEEEPEDDNKAYQHVEGIDDEDELEGEEGDEEEQGEEMDDADEVAEGDDD